MTDAEKIKRLAELDGWHRFEGFHPAKLGACSVCGNRYTEGGHDFKPYLTSYDAIIPLIQKQSQVVIHKIGIKLGHFYDAGAMLKSTPEQFADALLAATGKDEE